MIRIASITTAVTAAFLSGGLAVAAGCSKAQVPNAGIAAIGVAVLAIIFARIAMNAK